jgi:hypothetical protein
MGGLSTGFGLGLVPRSGEGATVDYGAAFVALLPDALIILAEDADAANGWLPLHGATPNGNHLCFDTGEALSSGSNVTYTARYALDSAAEMTATRMQGTGTWACNIGTEVLAAGDWTLEGEVKSNTGAGAQSFKFTGEFSANEQTINIDESGWTTITDTFTADGVASKNMNIRLNGMNVDMLAARFKLYQGTSAPAFDANHEKALCKVATPNDFAITNGLIDTTNAPTAMMLKLPSHPDTTAYDEGMQIAVFETEEAGTANLGKLIAHAANDPVTSAQIGVQLGGAWARPALPLTTGKLRYVADGTAHVLINLWKAGKQAVFLDGVPFVENTNTLATQTLRSLGIFGEPLLASPTWRFKGRISSLVPHADWQDDAGVQAIHDAALALHQSYGGSAMAGKNIAIGEGDSITAAGSNGFFERQFSSVWTGWYGIIQATGGATMSTVNTRLADTLKKVAAAVANGHTPVVTLLIGANGLPTLAELQTWRTAIEGAGGLPVIITVLHQVGDAVFNAAADVLNALIIADAANWAAVIRFDGVLTETVGVHYTDAKHPNAAGHALLDPIYRAGVEAAIA